MIEPTSSSPLYVLVTRDDASGVASAAAVDVALAIVFFSLAAAAVTARVIATRFSAEKAATVDQWLLVAALVCLTVLCLLRTVH